MKQRQCELCCRWANFCTTRERSTDLTPMSWTAEDFAQDGLMMGIPVPVALTG
jgi:hypothetical protein